MSLCIVDGYNFVFRAFHSLPPLSTSNNIPVGAVYGFVNMLAKLIENNDCQMLAIALDSGRKTFRNDLYKEYKAHREEPAEELKIQFPIIREAIEAFGVKAIEAPGFEADDIIATYTRVALNNKMKVRIISSDKDLVQLLQDGVEIYDPLKKKLIDYAAVEEKYGIRPNQMVDYLALIGDSSDNIPGVKNVGPKTAAKLLAEFGDLENIYNNIEKVEPIRVRALLEDSKENAILSKKLVILDDNVELPFTLEQLNFDKPKQDVLGAFLNKYEFKSLSTQRSLFTNADVQPQKAGTDVVVKGVTLDDIENLKPQIEEYGNFYFHIRSDSFSFYLQGILYEIHLSPLKEDVGIDKVLTAFLSVLEDASIKKICFDVKGVMHDCIKLKINLQVFDDLSLLFYTLNTGKKRPSLEGLLELYALGYNKHDAFSVFNIYNILRAQLLDMRQFEVYEMIEKPLLSLLVKIEAKGVKVDTKILENLEEEFSEKLKVLQNEIYQSTEVEFNIASPKQIGEVLFDKLKLEGGRKSKKTDAYITDAETLDKIAVETGNIVLQKILKWRQYSKLINTYTKALRQAVDHQDGRVHTTFSMVTTSTGRLSSHDPNLQNIPIKTDDGNKIRKAFVAEEGNLIVSADYSQIELRILAHIADIKALQEAFNHDKDVHSITASQVFGIPLENVDQDHRRKAKAINFGIIYGQSSYGLANSLNIDRKEASSYIESYFKQYPGIKEYMDRTVAFARKHGYVKTLMGRKCYVENINSNNYNLKNFAERAAINAPIQGTASEIIKKAMVSLNSDLQKFLILQIHDELLFEVPEQLVEKSCVEIEKAMKDVVNLSVPIKLDVSYGRSWYDTKP
ncbi:DNA polymerase I [Candidatus Bandiella euplotis]|uniref:DNA polymerase I n=1 Tax=Candidatus Bandiella euplotis TaxID=1664265 RepID=A0ABZ0UJT0_9RICK|nr:DNA polymerase I [Candidatus Bandiella woodruffii]WPX95944.1 DNA polymerase I [Candidatus Bandiella woodruffii]